MTGPKIDMLMNHKLSTGEFYMVDSVRLEEKTSDKKVFKIFQL